jgi:maltose/moltooligosaccharide transporter
MDMHTKALNKPRLSFWQLWNMSFGFFGIQFGFALQNANTSRIFSTLGANPDDLALFWLAAPVTGLLVQPIIGYMSDNTWHPKWGRRRPFFFVGALLAMIAMFLMPNSSALWMAVAMLWMLDAAINVSMEPFRAFVGDKLDVSQQTAGYAMQTFFIGCGAVIASLLPTIFTSLGVSNIPVDGSIPETVRYSFYAGALVFMGAVSWTVFTADELPPPDMAAFDSERKHARKPWRRLRRDPERLRQDAEDDGAAGFRAVLHLDRAVRDVDLYRQRDRRLGLRHPRRPVGRLPGRRQLGRHHVRRV